MDFVTGEILAIDKPLGWTSFDVVKRLRGAILRRLGIRKFKVGHAGTLDPLATGVLIICTGKATRFIESLQQGVKRYEATLTLGATTPSYDLETEIDRRYPFEHITIEDIEQTLPKFRGQIMQIPPIFSAVKIDGKRAYKFARKGQDITLRPKSLTIDELELTKWDLPELKLKITCSKGTYIRALARDIGETLGCGAYLSELRRTQVGEISEKDCLSVDQAIQLITETPLEFPEWYEHTK